MTGIEITLRARLFAPLRRALTLMAIVCGFALAIFVLGSPPQAAAAVPAAVSAEVDEGSADGSSDHDGG